MGPYSLVDVTPNAAPVLLSNDFSRVYGQSASAPASAVAPVFRVKGGSGTIRGTYVANRSWVENAGSSRYAFVDAGASGVFSPEIAYSNWAGPSSANFFAVWQGTSGTPFSALDTLPTAQPVNPPPNLVSDLAVATPYAFQTLPSLPPPLLQGEGLDAADRAQAIDAAAPTGTWGRLPLGRDLRDRPRPLDLSDVGAQEVDTPPGA